MIERTLVAIIALLVGVTLEAAEDPLLIQPAVLSVIDASDVAAEEAGVVMEVSARVGQRVQAGDILAQLDDRDAHLELDRATIEYKRAVAANDDISVRSAKEAATLAELDLQRARDSISRYAKSVSEAQINRLEIIVKRARLDVEQAEHDLQATALLVRAAKNGVHIAKRGIERRKIVAPIGGTVVTIASRQGEWVDSGDTVFRLVNIDRLRAEAFVEITRLSGDELQGRETVFLIHLPDEEPAEFPGVVTFVSPEVNRVNGQVRIWTDVDNSHQQLRPGMTGRLLVRGVAPEQVK